MHPAKRTALLKLLATLTRARLVSNSMARCVLMSSILEPRNSTQFLMRPFFLFASFAGHPFSRFLSAPFRPFLPLFCRAKGTAQSLERGGSRMDLSTKFGKEIPSRNLHEKKVSSFEDSFFIRSDSSGWSLVRCLTRTRTR